MPSFTVNMPPVMTREEISATRAVLADDTEDQIKNTLREVLDAYEHLLERVRMADLMGYRAKLLAEDMQAEIEAGKKRRGGPPRPEGIANMAKVYVNEYVDVILPMLREPLGFEDGDERAGWYVGPEDARAKIVGARRANERLRREGR